MKEYVIQAKVKNNLILSRILESYSSVSQFCLVNDLNNTTVGRFINMQAPALTPGGAWNNAALKLADALGEDPSDLFTTEQAEAKLKTNEAYIEMSRQQVLALSDPLQVLEASDLVTKLLGNCNLSSREEAVLQLRFYDELSLDDIGKRLEISTERVRQIEAKSLRKLRKTASVLIECPTLVKLNAEAKERASETKRRLSEIKAEVANRLQQDEFESEKLKGTAIMVRSMARGFCKGYSPIRLGNISVSIDRGENLVKMTLELSNDTHGARLQEVFKSGLSKDECEAIMNEAKEAMVEYFKNLKPKDQP